MSNNTLNLALSQLVDEHGLHDVLHGLTIVCREKSDHCERFDRHGRLARKWLDSAVVINYADSVIYKLEGRRDNEQGE